MQEKEFEQKNKKTWQTLDTLLTATEKKQGQEHDLSTVPELLQKQSQDLALARYRMYSTELCATLNQQVLRGFKLVQKSKGATTGVLWMFFRFHFPMAIRQEWRLHLICWAVFLLPVITIIGLTNETNMEWVNSALSPAERDGLDSSWAHDTGSISNARGNGGDFMMFAFYINNNVSIDFQIFAGGVLGGVGSLYILFFNGLKLGATFAYVMEYGDIMKLYGFVSSHAPYELWAMILSGMAGLRLGLSLLAPGRYSRVASLKQAGKTAIPLILGAAFLTFFAAIIEGFWSANDFLLLGGHWFKIGVGGVGWLLLCFYFFFVGRNQSLKSQDF